MDKIRLAYSAATYELFTNNCCERSSVRVCVLRVTQLIQSAMHGIRYELVATRVGSRYSTVRPQPTVTRRSADIANRSRTSRGCS